MLYLLVFLILSYLIGSFSFSIVLTKIIKHQDIRNLGSGNAGATNTFRVLGPKFGLLVALLDISKAFFPTLFFIHFFDGNTLYAFIAGFGVVLGHVFPLYHKFKGGKGIACATGLCLALFPFSIIACLIIFFAILFSSGYVSLSSIIVAILLPFFYLGEILLIQNKVFDYNSIIILVIIIFLVSFVIYKHKQNIIRLKNREEPRVEKLRFTNWFKSKSE